MGAQRSIADAGSHAPPAWRARCPSASIDTSILARLIEISSHNGNGSRTAYGNQARTPGAPMWTSAASKPAAARPASHHHGGTHRRSVNAGAGTAPPVSDGRGLGEAAGECSDTQLRVVSRNVSHDNHETKLTEFPPIALVRLDPDLPLPVRAHPGDAGVDLVSAIDVTIEPLRRALVGTGIAVALPLGTVGLIHPRSGLAAKTGLSIVNTPGTVDAGYRGEIKVCLINHDPETAIEIRRGDRIAQLLVQKVELVSFVETQTLDDTSRGAGGYGSSGGHSSLARG